VPCNATAARHADLQAIKIVDRNPKRKRLTGLNRANAGKMVNESEYVEL
jgi:hypothetical protein